MVNKIEAIATKIKDLNIKIATKSPMTLAITITNTLTALIFGLLMLSKPTPVILSIGNNKPYMENTRTISTTLNPVMGSVFKN
ncbi:hypothetical protein FLACHUCJ7_04540 [Flavobacterium chungangense]|uniref:Uncharacterized protein n=1 Tax=Flavobacterium chungangense TaxID=554283 RepID=A0A6V6ZDN9_9FLAO|nr:hypothetical protein FLACHUCJ7_04540 [Flavobacterium chungangense]